MEAWGLLVPGQSLIHDRDGQYCPAWQQSMDTAGVKRVPLPPRSPHLNAYAAHWVRSSKEGCWSQRILCGEASLRHLLTHDLEHLHHESKHQGKGHVLRFPRSRTDERRTGPMRCRERLGGLLQYSTREAAGVS